MIDNLDDLVQYTEQVARAIPIISDEIRITRPGYQSDVVAALKHTLPGLPESYLTIIESLAIDGIAIGYFRLTPSSSRATSLVDKLRNSNDPALTPMAKHYQQHGVYEVASWEADPICVAYADSVFEIGQVVMYRIDMPLVSPSVLADSFEQLLLQAGNLQEISGKYDDPEQALREFRSYLAPLVAGRQDDMESAWMQIASVVLG